MKQTILTIHIKLIYLNIIRSIIKNIQCFKYQNTAIIKIYCQLFRILKITCEKKTVLAIEIKLIYRNSIRCIIKHIQYFMSITVT